MRSLRSAVPLLVLIGACIGSQLDAPLTQDEVISIKRYLDCIDCVELLDSVRALATRKPQATVDSLNSGLLNGPGVVAVRQADSVLFLGYTRDQQWRASHGLLPLPDSATYVTAARSRYVDGYRSRGAIGMGWIHTPRAVTHLDSALTLPLPPTVLRSVKYARDSLPPQ